MSDTPRVYEKAGLPDRVATRPSQAVALEFEGYKPKAEESEKAPKSPVPTPPKPQETPKP